MLPHDFLQYVAIYWDPSMYHRDIIKVFLYCTFIFQVTGKKILEKGELKRRYTIIPLNKISARTLNDSVVNSAKDLVINL